MGTDSKTIVFTNYDFRSCDARQLVISSRDGFCTIVTFDDNELGEIYRERVTNPEAIQDTMDIDNTNADSTAPSSGTEIDTNGTKNCVVESRNTLDAMKEKDSPTLEDQEMDTSIATNVQIGPPIEDQKASTTAVVKENALTSSQVCHSKNLSYIFMHL